MSLNIRVNKVCEFCKQDFEARKTTSKTCSDNCAKRLYKERLKNSKMQSVKIDTEAVKVKPIEDLKAKEFLSITDTCFVLGISRRTIYRMIERKEIKAGKAGKRTLIRRTELDKLFNK